MAASLAMIFFTMCMFMPAVVYAQTASAASLGQYCVQDSDCGGSGLVCNKSSTNCAYGQCACQYSYAFDYVLLTCLQGTALGLPCGANYAACRTLNSQCLNGICTCNTGYKRKFSSDHMKYICEPTTATGVYGSPCYDSTFCLPSLTCNPNTKQCGCDIGFTYTANPKRFCVPTGVGDACLIDNDCVTCNGYCTSGTCQCAGGYKSVNWRVQFQDSIRGTYSTWVIPACIGAIEPVVTTGQQCLTALKRSQSFACDSTDICLPCNSNVNNTGYCAAMSDAPASYASHSSVLLSSATSLKGTSGLIAISLWHLKAVLKM